MATILQAADLYKLRAEPVFDQKDAAYWLDLLIRKGEADARTQVAWAVALLNIRDDRRRETTVDLAHEIVMRQIERCNVYGASTRPLTKKQCAVIVNAADKERRKD